MRHSTQLKYKKRVPISSLEAAICNVALFKSMKEKEFKDEIFISYCSEGVILQAISEKDWNQAYKHIDNFLNDKKIALLTYGYQKQVYEQLILKGLKEYTRRIKQKCEQCPYINVIHYQKLRKSCQYMDKQKYLDPLKQWEKKYKTNPNFAFLIVEPKIKFQQAKRSLLQFLLNKQIQLQQIALTPLEFFYYFFNSISKEEIKQSYTKKFIEISMLENTYEKDHTYNQKIIKIVNYTDTNFEQYQLAIVKDHKNLSKLGLQFLSSNDFKQKITNNNIKYFLKDGNQLFQAIHNNLLEQYGDNYAIISYKKTERGKYMQIINKFTNIQHTKQELQRNLKKFVVCGYSDLQFFQRSINNQEKISIRNNYKTHIVNIKYCPYMLHQYYIAPEDLDTFILYLEQLSLYYNTYIVRFYGICLHPNSSSTYFLIFDYHSRTLADMLNYSQILDSHQVATMVLQILYFINYLHTHEQPRCLGKLELQQIYWPMCIVLPYLSELHENSIEGDVRLAGNIFKQLIEQDAQDFANVLQLMLKQNKYDRITLSKCINTFQELLSL